VFNNLYVICQLRMYWTVNFTVSPELDNTG